MQLPTDNSAAHASPASLAGHVVLLSGGGGLVGRALAAAVRAAGGRVRRLVRAPAVAGADAVLWEPARNLLPPAALTGVTAVVHLAGRPIMAPRWTAAVRREIYDSRVRSTALLAAALARGAGPPPVFICASAVGYYGDGGDRELREDSPRGTGFLADVCAAWEAACAPAAAVGCRVVNARFGMILAADGGALPLMARVFRCGLGGMMGSGQQYVSWITLADTVAILTRALHDPVLAGPLNVVSPQPVTDRTFAHALGTVLQRPTWCTMPAFVARLVLGQLAEELLLSGQRVLPEKLLAAGYVYQDPTLEPALARLLAAP